MSDSRVQPTAGTPVPSGKDVFRFVLVRSDGELSTAFEPSTDDKAEPVPTVSVWVFGIALPAPTANLLQKPYDGYLLLAVDFIRLLVPTIKLDVPPLDVVQRPLRSDSPGSEHAGITGLVRPNDIPRSTYKTIRSHLAVEGRKRYTSLR